MKSVFVLLAAFWAVVTATSSAETSCISGCTCKHPPDNNEEKAVLISNCALDISRTNFINFDQNFTTIKFNNVIIRTVEQDALSGFENLNHIIVDNSSVMKIAPMAFDLDHIHDLKFLSTKFKSPPKIASKQLSTLIFIDCQLTQIPDLDDLPSLTILKLDNNSISEIADDVFAKAESLEEVTLSNNSLSELSLKVFFNNTELNFLQLDNNPLKSLQIDFDIGLEYLSARSCELTSFNTNQNLQLVNRLDLSDNQIAILNLDAFEGMTDLNVVDLSRNGLIELDDNIFEDCSDLQKIILDGNKFEKLPKFKTVDKIFQMLYFSCNNCGLKSVDGAFDNMPGMITVNLANNEISNVDGVFDMIEGLKELDLSGNKLTTIRYTAFSKNRALSDLNLSGNPLKPLDPLVLTNLQLLTKLDMSNTGLTQLWDNHNAILKSLERLLIGKNQLKTITVDDLKITPEIKLLDIEGNQFDCSGDLRESVKWLIRKEVYPIRDARKLKTHDDLELSEVTSFETFNSEDSWRALLYRSCPNDDNLLLVDEFFTKIALETKDELPTTMPTTTDDYSDAYLDDDDDYSEEYDDRLLNGEGNEDILMGERLDNDDDDDMIIRNSDLTQASYILSITSVFIITALAVLTVAVSIILLILRKNGAFNVQNGNVPRFKLPIWHTVPSQKKHSGSVYKSLSEDRSGPKTPMINRYEFKSTPQVHNSIP